MSKNGHIQYHPQLISFPEIGPFKVIGTFSDGKNALIQGHRQIFS
jgi:hypothetical protein